MAPFRPWPPRPAQEKRRPLWASCEVGFAPIGAKDDENGGSGAIVLFWSGLAVAARFLLLQQLLEGSMFTDLAHLHQPLRGSSPALPLNWVSVAARPPFLLPPAAARRRVRGLDHHSMIDVN